MPTYDYECIKCGYTFEESLKIADRDAPTELPCVQQITKTKHMSFECGGEVKQMVVAPGFAYDNIKTKHSVKPAVVGQLNDRLKDIKSRYPGNTL
jgi:putative FmdB family regulatory protein